MARYIEYDIASGRIISELKSETPPQLSAGTALLEIDSDVHIEIPRYIVVNGELKKILQTNAEKSEQDRIRQEYSESVRARVKNMMDELCLAMLENDETEISRLRREYQTIRAYV